MQLKHYSKRTKMIIGTIMTVALTGSLVFGSQLDFRYALTSMSDAETEPAMEEVIPVALTPVYDIVINDVYVGTVDDLRLADGLVQQAKRAIEAEVGYKPDYTYDLEVNERLVEHFSGDLEIVSAAIRSEVLLSAGEIKVKAYAMKIDDFCVVVESEEALISVLEKAQSLYVKDDSAISVNLVQDAHNPLILIPEVQILSKELPKERVFVTSDMTTAPPEAEGEPMEDLFADNDKFLEAVVKDVRLEQSILIVETFVLEEQLTDPETAIEMITKEHEKEKTYVVEKGDSPSVIAVENNMSTSDLYELNPGLKENARSMQIGDELVVMVPEPELFVTTVEDVIYTEIIDREIIYVNNADEYIGTNRVIDAGADGIIEIRATVEKLNGKIVNEVINETTVILEPVTEFQSRGIKALPVTTATGTFEMPMISYTFTSGFGYRWGRLHKGIDLAAPTGTAIKASDGGRVIKAGWDGGYGYAIEIDHGHGMTSKYAHCSALYVAVGDEVSQYQTIAAVGNTGNSTGPHLHFEIRKNGTPQDPMGYIE